LLDDKLEQHKSSLTLESSASCGLDLLSHEDRKSSQGSANIEVSNGSEGGTANKDSLRESKTAQTSSRPMRTSDMPRRQRVSRRSLLDDKLEQHKSSLTLESSASCGLDLLSHEDRKSSQGSANIEVSNGSEGGTANKDSLRESKTAQTPSTLTSSKNKYESWEDLEGVLEATLAMSISAINSDAQGK